MVTDWNSIFYKIVLDNVIVIFCSRLGGAIGTHKCWTISFLTKAIEIPRDMSTFVKETSVSSSMTVRLSPAIDTAESSVLPNMQEL